LWPCKQRQQAEAAESSRRTSWLPLATINGIELASVSAMRWKESHCTNRGEEKEDLRHADSSQRQRRVRVHYTHPRLVAISVADVARQECRIDGGARAHVR
jgi:hypothetical protein